MGAFQQTIAYLSQPVRFSLLVAVVTTLSLMLTSAQIPFGRSPKPAQVAAIDREIITSPGQPVAKLAEVAGVRWAAEFESLSAGAIVMRDQRLNIDEGRAVLQFLSGAKVTVDGPALFQVVSRNAAFLQRGKISAKAPPRARGFTIRTPNIDVVDLGTEFEVDVNPAGVASVAVSQGAVEVHSFMRTPRWYWNFDDRVHPGADAILKAESLVGPGATPAPGMVGEGALDFNNTPSAFVDAGADGFEVVEGLTIEALIKPRWNAAPGNYDEVFRKEDGDRRILLAFQNDRGMTATAPSVAVGPALAFGVHLTGQGYSELDMPLDGEDERPSITELTDGQPHHLVATYDARTGLKAIYIDGIRRISVRFPGNPRLVTGGPARATVGNLAPHQGEPFDGVLDEVAFYDFALTAEEIAAHYANVQQEVNYFGLPPATPPQSWRSITPLSAGQRMEFAPGTGLPLHSSP